MSYKTLCGQRVRLLNSPFTLQNNCLILLQKRQKKQLNGMNAHIYEDQGFNVFVSTRTR